MASEHTLAEPKLKVTPLYIPTPPNQFRYKVSTFYILRNPRNGQENILKLMVPMTRSKHKSRLQHDVSHLQPVSIYLFGVLRRFQHCTGHITTGSWKGRGNQYIQFVRVLYCKLPTNGKQLPAFPLEAVPGIEPRPQM